MTSLYVIRGRDQGVRFELGDIAVSIGRDATNTIRLRDTEISRRHGEVRKEGEHYVFVDMNSSNGSFVNQSKIESHILKTGDRLRLGRTWLLFTQTDSSNEITHGPKVDIVDEGFDPEPSRIVTTSRANRMAVGELDASDLESDMKRAQANLEIMLRTAQEVAHTMDIDQLCSSVLDLVFHRLGADRGCLMLMDNDTNRLRVKVARDREGDPDSAAIAISQSILDYVLEHEEGVLTSNAREDERWDSGASIVRYGVREAICVPMQGRYGIVGILYIDTASRTADLLDRKQSTRFQSDHLEVLIAIGNQAALAIEDTAYYSAMVQSERLAAIGTTVATLSHHIKNMLQGLKGGGFLIEEGLKQEDGEAVQRGWEMVDRNQQKISDLVLDMLTFSKEREPTLEMGDLNDVIKDVVEVARHRAESNDIRLDWKPSPEIPELAFDGAGVHRAVLNLVTNAIDECIEQEADRVAVETRWNSSDQAAIIQVRDNGKGIPADKLDLIFRPFESSKGNRGTGLGLAATKKIIQEHGGEVLVKSELGQGSLFSIVLPRSESLDDRPSKSETQTLQFEPNESQSKNPGSST